MLKCSTRPSKGLNYGLGPDSIQYMRHHSGDIWGSGRSEGRGRIVIGRCTHQTIRMPHKNQTINTTLVEYHHTIPPRPLAPIRNRLHLTRSPTAQPHPTPYRGVQVDQSTATVPAPHHLPLPRKGPPRSNRATPRETGGRPLPGSSALIRPLASRGGGGPPRGGV
jgi:hypothetical protein